MNESENSIITHKIKWMADCHEQKIYIFLKRLTISYLKSPSCIPLVSLFILLIPLKFYFHVSFIFRSLATSMQATRYPKRCRIPAYRGMRIALLLNSGIKHPVLDSRIKGELKSIQKAAFVSHFSNLSLARLRALHE